MEKTAGFNNILARFEQKPPGIGKPEPAKKTPADPRKMPVTPAKPPGLAKKPPALGTKPGLPTKSPAVAQKASDKLNIPSKPPVGAKVKMAGLSLEEVLKARKQLNKSEEDLTSTGKKDTNAKENKKDAPAKIALPPKKTAMPVPNKKSSPPPLEPKQTATKTADPQKTMFFQGKPLQEVVILPNGKKLRLKPFVPPTTGPPARPPKPHNLKEIYGIKDEENVEEEEDLYDDIVLERQTEKQRRSKIVSLIPDMTEEEELEMEGVDQKSDSQEEYDDVLLDTSNKKGVRPLSQDSEEIYEEFDDLPMREPLLPLPPAWMIESHIAEDDCA